MRDAKVKLGELADPMAFLTGARIPMTLATPMATWQRYEWISDRLLVRLCSDRAWVERDGKIDWNLYLMDLSDPDVARWVDRKIGALTYVSGDGWTLRIARRVCREERGGWSMKRTGIAAQFPVWNRQGRAYRNTSNHDRLCRLDCPALATIPCDEAHLPTTRAALLRALFGVSNA